MRHRHLSRRRPIVSELPHSVYPVDPWAIVETRFTPELTELLETVFALGNGYVGVRGSFHQGRPAHQPGALINGYYEAWPIVYPESAFGFATAGQTIVYVPDSTESVVKVNGEPIDYSSPTIEDWERRLDFRRGTLVHRYRWTSEDGIGVQVTATRLVSVARPELVACQLVISVDTDAEIEISSGLLNRQDTEYLEPAATELDPRRARNFGRRVLEPTALRIRPEMISASYETVRSHLRLAVSMAQTVDRPAEATSEEHPDHPHTIFRTSLADGETLTLDKFTVYHADNARGIDHTEDQAAMVSAAGFEAAVKAHDAAWDEFWDMADIHIGADEAVQQATRWILLQLHQASAHLDGTGIAAKGVTGQAYEGHYFWDTEIFVLPFLLYTRPEVVAGLLRFRYQMLDEARARASELNLAGALFPWRTINGNEASAYFVAGTAQYHINADVAYAIRKYVEVTGDLDLLWDVGVEILVETARMWARLGFHRDGAFHIYGVTGPDEYTAIVDDNAYTNLMAQMNLLYAIDSVEKMRKQQPTRWAELDERLAVTDEEIEEWRRAGTEMHFPYDEGFGITKQDESFLAKERWDFESVPEDRYPLLLHFHPLTIYRYQVLKQADVVLATVLSGEKFSDDLKRANFDYYDPLTTGDSSLSACVQAIAAAQIGEAELAMHYFRTALFTDLADLHHNTTDGVHLASAGGVWMALVYGMAGLSDRNGEIRFEPGLPRDWGGLRFKLRVRDTVLSVDMDHDRVLLKADGRPVGVTVDGTTVTVGELPVTVAIGRSEGSRAASRQRSRR